MAEPKPLNPKEIAALDQITGLLRDCVTPLLKSFYAGCMENGFTEGQAMWLTGEYLKGLLTKPLNEKE